MSVEDAELIIEFQDLKLAIVAAQHRSLRQAAEALNLRQSTLSRRLRDLEYHLGAVLFERTTGGTKSTVAGREFIEAAKHILDDAETMFSKLRSRHSGNSGNLKIGICTYLSAGNLRATLLEHRFRFPDVEINMAEVLRGNLLFDLNTSVIDVAIVGAEYVQSGEKYLPLWSERVVVALPESHLLCGQQIIRWQQLMNERILVSRRALGPKFQDLLAAKLGRSQADDVRLHDVGLDHLLSMVSLGFGLLLVLEGATGASYPGVTYREIHDEDGPTRLHFVACWQKLDGNPTVAPFLDLLRERYPDLSARASGAKD